MMQLEDNAYILPSDAKEDRALAMNVGLKTLVRVQDIAQIYSQRRRAADDYVSDPVADMHYAFAVLNDHPAIETPLTQACRDSAKTLIDTLKSRCGYHRPALIIDNGRG